MGTRMAPQYANIFMADLEQRFLSSRPLKPLLYLRYIDDIFIIWTHGKEALEEFHHDFNNFHPTTNLSLVQSTQEIHFLDTTVLINNGHINTTLYRKPTDRYSYLHASSFHPDHTTRSIVYSQALRYNRICSNPSDRDKHLQDLCQAFLQLQYPPAEVKKQIDRARRVPRSYLLQDRPNKENNRTPLAVTFSPQLKPLQRIIKDLQPILKDDPTLSQVLGDRSVIMQARCAELQIQFTEAVSTVADQKELITNLERDLSTIQSMSSMHRPDAEGAAVHSLETIPDPIKEATALFYGYPQSSPSTPLPEGQMDSLLSIISSQRERFRTRNQELEAENRMMQHTMQALQSELDNMRADNIKLYEKIKFLQSYPGRGGSSDDTELRYSTQYEERLDPFSSFSRKERQRKYLSLSPWDKATLSMGRLILSSKAARTVAFFYTLLLHCLVFLVLYKTAWSESVGRDCTAYCAKKYADHLHKFHENGDNGDMWQ
ncbi:unnamed protein product [Caretta caretta]